MKRLILLVLFPLFTCTSLPPTFAEPPMPVRCELVPLPGHSVSLQIDGIEKTRWHHGSDYPRPFFYPLNGPSGTSLTRMGHPGAPNHDHHQSVWFAHHDIEGNSYWANGKNTRIMQKQWLAYEDGDAEARMATALSWRDPEDREVMHQDMIAAIIPHEDGQYELEIQIEFSVPRGAEKVVVGKSNFGFFAVRVARSLSEYFGGGRLSNSEGAVGEPDIFGQRARWMDYSGPVASGTGQARKVQTEGITFHDHPSNPRYPTGWHVRSDGWMGASFAMFQGVEITSEQPLRLRYSLNVHSGPYDQEHAQRIHKAFSKRPPMEVTQPKNVPHRFRVIKRVAHEQP